MGVQQTLSLASAPGGSRPPPSPVGARLCQMALLGGGACPTQICHSPTAPWVPILPQSVPFCVCAGDKSRQLGFGDKSWGRDPLGPCFSVQGEARLSLRWGQSRPLVLRIGDRAALTGTGKLCGCRFVVAAGSPPAPPWAMALGGSEEPWGCGGRLQGTRLPQQPRRSSGLSPVREGDKSGKSRGDWRLLPAKRQPRWPLCPPPGPLSPEEGSRGVGRGQEWETVEGR